MKKHLYLLPILLSGSVLAQNNYVANTPNSAIPGTNNTLVGPSAGNATMTGGFNTFMGFNAGLNNTTGSQNVFLGMIAGAGNTRGSNNSFVGSGAGQNNTTGNGNTFTGSYAGSSNLSGFANSFLGANAGTANTTGYQNSFVGHSAGHDNSTGFNNAFMGYLAGYSNTTGSYNTFVGNQAGNTNTTGDANTFIGANTGSVNTTGVANSFLGGYAGQSNTTGSGNSFLGYFAGFTNTTGGANTFTGNKSGQNNATGYSNTFMGNSSGFENTNGWQNTYVGQDAGYFGSGGTNNVFIGYRSGVNLSSTVVSNAIALGTYAIVTQNNSMALGGTGAYAVRVGINNAAPQNRLEITQGVANQSGLRLTNLTSSSPASVVNQTKFLSVNASGDVVMASMNSSAREGASSGLWQENGDNLQNTNSGGIIIGPGIGKTPVGYRLYVADGVLTEKVKVAVKTTNDWSDRVFEKGYTLRTLDEVERYINQKNHLPGIPSAQEVVKEGVDLGKMDAKLLEKVEEMTLYMIAIHKEVNTLRQENKALRQELKKVSQQKGK